MNKEFIVTNPKEFKVVIEEILSQYFGDKMDALVIALQGDLGAGKTTFAQQLANYLEVKEVVTSPTFAIMKQYDLSHAQFDRLIHVDAYRFESEAEAGPLGLAVLMRQSRLIVCVEWPELIPSIVPEEAVWVKIENKEGETRLVTVSSKSEK